MRIRPGFVTAVLSAAFVATVAGAALHPVLTSSQSVPEGETWTAASLHRPPPLTAEHVQIRYRKDALQSIHSQKVTVRHRFVRPKVKLAAVPAVSQAPAQPAYVPPPAAPGFYSYAALEAIWVANGGSAAEESTAACIAEHESGGNPGAESPSDDFGLWQEHADRAALNPQVSAATAVSMSDDGTNWSPWTTAGDCGV